MDSINMCYEMCDYIEQNGIVKLTGNIRLRDNLKKEFLHFLIYINDRWKVRRAGKSIYKEEAGV